MPGIDGLELQEELKRRNSPLSVIILTGYADVPLAVRAIKNGALDILQKPFNRAQLLAAGRIRDRHIEGKIRADPGDERKNWQG